MHQRTQWRTLAVALIGFVPAGCARPKPTVWYCQAYNTTNNLQYKVDETSDRGWSRVHASLAEHVDWRVDTQPAAKERLIGVNLVVILNPEAEAWEGGTPPHLMQDDEIDALDEYVRAGGALLFGSNQDDLHNIEKPRSNRLLERFGLRVGNEDIGVKRLVIPRTVPVVGGLRWRFFFGSGVTLTGDAPDHAEIWSWNNPRAPTLEGKPGKRVPLMVAAESGDGRVIVVGDSGWTANGTIGLDDNWPILWQQIRWLTRERLPSHVPKLAAWNPPRAD